MCLSVLVFFHFEMNVADRIGIGLREQGNARENDSFGKLLGQGLQIYIIGRGLKTELTFIVGIYMHHKPSVLLTSKHVLMLKYNLEDIWVTTYPDRSNGS